MAENNCQESSSHNDIFKKTSNNRMRNFHFRYLELCRSKNFPPVPEIKAKNHEQHFILDFVGDKLRVDDWNTIIESLYHDQTLTRICIRMRKNCGHVLDNLDTDKKARMLKNKPAIFSKFLFDNLIDAISNNIKCNQNLINLTLEAFTFDEKYIMSIIKAISINENLKTLSFARSVIGDNGCEAICSSLKYLLHIENINLNQCQLTVQGAVYVADMIKFQKIYRYTEGWKKSLRYRDVNTETIPGLRTIFIANNPDIGDKGVELITETLKEDVWIKEIDMTNCGITDIGGKFILDCLGINKFIQDFRVKGNPEISSLVLRNINTQLGIEDDRSHEKGKNKHKLSVPKIRERVHVLEEQIQMEKNLRKQVENLNEELHSQIVCYERQLTEYQQRQQQYEQQQQQQTQHVDIVQDGFIMISKEALDLLVKERDNLKNALSTVKVSKSRNNFKRISRIHKAKSETKYVEVEKRRNNNTKSEHIFKADEKAPKQNIYIEKNMGDTTLTKSVLKPNLQDPYIKKMDNHDAVHHNNHNYIKNNNNNNNINNNNDNYNTNINNNKKMQVHCSKTALLRTTTTTTTTTTSGDSSSDLQVKSKLSSSNNFTSNRSTVQNNSVTSFKGIEQAIRLFVQKNQNQDYSQNNRQITNVRTLFMGNDC